ncbi:MAG: porin [Burkholderiales bacterium]|nr:porin [Burkholderiales bacterium]
MNKTLLVALAAAALAVQGTARAQSSLTITGFFKLTYEHIKLGDFGRAGKDSEDRVVDDLSRIYFRVVEDLGDGVQAIGQVEWRINFPAGSDAANGNNWVGLKSKRFGTLTFGRNDLHYHQTPSTITSKGSLRAWNTSIIAAAGGGGTIIAYDSRTPNVVYYESPKWNGFDVIAAYSTNPGASSEADLGSTTRDGRGINIVPRYMTQDWGVVYSYWDAKHDNSPTHQRADRVWGFYTLQGFRIGAAYDWSEVRNDTAGVTTSKREAWSIPLSYRRGRHNFWLEYSEADDDDKTAANDGAKMWAAAYAYDFSRRTSLALTYAEIRNDSGAVYNLYNSAASQGGSADAVVAPGEDPRIIGVTMRHAF